MERSVIQDDMSYETPHVALRQARYTSDSWVFSFP